jgi:hypothetical protein
MAAGLYGRHSCLMLTCPRCKLINPPQAKVCDCGYELQLPVEMQAPEMRRRPTQLSGKKSTGYLLIGIVLVSWIVLLIATRHNNLVGIAMIWLVPLSLVLLGIALVLIAASR